MKQEYFVPIEINFQSYQFSRRNSISQLFVFMYGLRKNMKKLRVTMQKYEYNYSDFYSATCFLCPLVESGLELLKKNMQWVEDD